MQSSRFYILVIGLAILLTSYTESRIVKEILDCIHNKTTLNDINDICINKTEDKACKKTVSGMHQCFLNNQCYNQNGADQMQMHCWNCWADYMTDSNAVIDFQQKVQTCKWENKLSYTFMVILVVILAFMSN